jgi:hypothetical protein
VVLSHHPFAHPEALDDLETDRADLEAVLDAAHCAPCLLLSWGGSFGGLRLAGAREDLVPHVVVVGALGLGRTLTEGTDAIMASEQVSGAMEQLLCTGYPAALRTMIESTNPQMTSDEVRSRVQQQVEFCSHEAAVERARVWLGHDARDGRGPRGGPAQPPGPDRRGSQAPDRAPVPLIPCPS